MRPNNRSATQFHRLTLYPSPPIRAAASPPSPLSCGAFAPQCQNPTVDLVFGGREIEPELIGIPLQHSVTTSLTHTYSAPRSLKFTLLEAERFLPCFRSLSLLYLLTSVFRRCKFTATRCSPGERLVRSWLTHSQPQLRYVAAGTVAAVVFSLLCSRETPCPLVHASLLREVPGAEG